MEDRSRRRARLILIVGVLLAALAAAGTFFVSSSSQTAGPAAVPTSDVLVAARELPGRTLLQAADLKKVKMNADVVPPAAVKDEKDVIGKVTTTPMSTGEVVLTTKFAGTGPQPFTVFPPETPITPGQAIPPTAPHWRAFSITVPDNAAVGGVIQVGDVVDIVYTMTIDPVKIFFFPNNVLPTGSRQVADVSVKIAIERIPIIAKTGTLYTIRMDAASAEQIIYLQSAGAQIQFLLRAPQDDRVVNTAGATLGPVFQAYKFRIPEKLTP